MKFDLENLKFYGRIHGKKLHKTRQKLIDEFLPKISIAKPKENEEINLDEIFSHIKPKEYWLEIGFGGGEHLAGQALKNKDVGIVGCEVFINGVASLAAHLTGCYEDGTKYDCKLEDNRVDNVRIFSEDVRRMLNAIPDETFSKIFVLFPDPWPKKKHSSRRMIVQENLDVFSRILKKGGLLRVASDDMNYIRWSLYQLSKHKDFKWTAERASDWQKQPKDWVNTRYEQKAIKEGRKPIYLNFIKE